MSDMQSVSACEKVEGTAELLGAILLYLPLSDLFRLRQVSRSWKQLIERTKLFHTVREDSHIELTFRLPFQCSLSEAEEPYLEAELILWYDKPVTVRKVPGCLSSPDQLFFKFEEGLNEPTLFPPFIWPVYFRSRVLCFNRTRADRWLTLYPGEASSTIPWGLRSVRRRHESCLSGNLAFAEVGKTYVLKARPDFQLDTYVGTKEWLLAKAEEPGPTVRGDKLKAFKLDGGLPLIGADEVRFTVVP